MNNITITKSLEVNPVELIDVIPYITPEKILNNEVLYRPSLIYNLCPYREYQHFIEKRNIERIIRPKSVVAMETGKVLHNVIRNWFSKEKLYGWGKCNDCGYIDKNLKPMLNRSCPKCNSENVVYEEIFLQRGNLGGHIDIIYLRNDNKFQIVDIKTINNTNYNKILETKEIYPSYIYQLNAYYYLATQNNIEVNDQLLLLFFNKYTHELLEVVFEKDDLIIKDITSTIELTNYCILNNTPPPNIPCKDTKCEFHQHS